MESILFLTILIIPALAQISVSINYTKFKQLKNKKEITGYDVARQILDKNHLEDMYIVETKGNLTDHYDPNKKVIRLSSEIYHGQSIASIAVAAHECGHAIQDKEGYAYMRFRSFFFPMVNIATGTSYAIILIGLLLESLNLVWLGIGFVAMGLLFQIITLPVELDASKRAKKELIKLKLATDKEQNGVSIMLSAAASTYVASVLTSALELVRLILIFTNQDN